MPHLEVTYGYAKFFRERWAQKESFINVEQDIVTTPEFLKSMEECSSDICFAGHLYPNGSIEPGRHLSCVKITDRFIKRHINLFEDTADILMNRVALNVLISNAAGRHPHICYHGLVLHLHCTTQEEKDKYGP